jgi:hypothetical protein
LVLSLFGTAAHVVLRAPLPKHVDAADAEAKAAFAAAKRAAASVGLRAFAGATAATAVLASVVVGIFRACGVRSAADVRQQGERALKGG